MRGSASRWRRWERAGDRRSASAVAVGRPDAELVAPGVASQASRHCTQVSSLATAPSSDGSSAVVDLQLDAADAPVGAQATPATACRPGGDVPPERGTSIRDAVLIGPSFDQPRGIQ